MIVIVCLIPVVSVIGMFCIIMSMILDKPQYISPPVYRKQISNTNFNFSYDPDDPDYFDVILPPDDDDDSTFDSIQL